MDELPGWLALDWRHGMKRYVRSDGSEIYPRITAAGNERWHARHALAGLAATDRGNERPFSSARAAEKWIKIRDLRNA